MHDPIADLLTRIRNAGSAYHPTAAMPHSKLKESVASVLKQEGYISDFQVAGTVKRTLTITLKYEGRRPVFVGLRQISTPGLRRYVASTEIPRVLGGMGVAILSTPRGIMSGYSAQKQNVGGEIVCYVW